MDRRSFLQPASMGAGGSLETGTLAPLANAQAKRPNLVIILADDMGFSDIGCYGSEMSTPSLNRVASQGIRFTHIRNTARRCPSPPPS
jgi:arylsulfatase